MMKKKPIVIFKISRILVFFGSLPSAGQNACHDDNGNVIPCKEPMHRYYDDDGHYDIHPMTYNKLDLERNSIKNFKCSCGEGIYPQAMATARSL